jgi:hypothetical protein
MDKYPVAHIRGLFKSMEYLMILVESSVFPRILGNPWIYRKDPWITKQILGIMQELCIHARMIPGFEQILELSTDFNKNPFYVLEYRTLNRYISLTNGHITGIYSCGLSNIHVTTLFILMQIYVFYE